MSAKEPKAVHELFVKAFNSGDLDAIVDLYEPEAILVSSPGEAICGREAIRETLRGFLTVSQRLILQVEEVFEIDGLALLSSGWRICGTDGQGRSVQLSGQMSDVLRRQDNGTWLIVIDNLSAV